MRTITVYHFDELPADVQEKVINKYGEDTIPDEWWDQDYEDALNVGIRITGHDVGRGDSITGEFNDLGIVANNILTEHGETTTTWFIAKQYTDAHLATIGSNVDDDTLDEMLQTLHERFEKDILNEYLKMLRNTYEHLHTDEAIREYLNDSNWEFTIDGKKI